MIVEYFEDTDLLLIRFGDHAIAKTRSLHDGVTLHLDAQGDVCAITIENASRTSLCRLEGHMVPRLA